MTSPEPFTPEIVDRTGYTVVEQGAEPGAQVTWAVTHDQSGTGLGAYADQAAIDRAIARHVSASTPPQAAKKATAKKAPAKRAAAKSK